MESVEIAVKDTGMVVVQYAWRTSRPVESRAENGIAYSYLML